MSVIEQLWKFDFKELEDIGDLEEIVYELVQGVSDLKEAQGKCVVTANIIKHLEG